jgi:hypothetical protein
MPERIAGRLGRQPAKRPDGLHMLAYYQENPLPKAPPNLGTPNVPNWYMLGNDRYGDCTFAGAYHAKMAVAQIDGIKESLLSDEEVVKAYLEYTNGQDQGAVEADLLAHWEQNGLFGSKIAAYAPTDHKDFDEIKSVVNTFGFCYIGILVPAPCQQQFAEHKPWDLTGTPADEQIEGGHCVIIVGYDEDMFYVVTWGEIQAVTKQWLQTYLEETWAIITPEAVKAGKIRDFRLEDLKADIAKLKG